VQIRAIIFDAACAVVANKSFRNFYFYKICLQFNLFLFATNCTNDASHLTRIIRANSCNYFRCCLGGGG